MNDAQIEAVAKACHEANRSWCVVNGDYSQNLWAYAEKWQQDSAINGVSFALTGATPEQQHEAWSADKREAGWVHGDVKDAVAKTHPCLVPYAALPPEQQAKDLIFVGVVAAFKAAFKKTGASK